MKLCNLINIDNSCGKLFDKFIIYLVIFFLLVITFETFGNNSVVYSKQIFYIDLFISSVFAFEFFLKLYCNKGKKKFMNIGTIIDFLSFAPFFILLIVSYFIHNLNSNISEFINILIMLRFVRIFKVFRLLEEISITKGFIHSLKDYLDEYKAVFSLFLIVLFILSFSVYYFEHTVNPNLDNMLKALRWGVVTATTVGYGDVFPVTVIGKFIAVILILLGPLVIGIFSAITVAVFMDSTEKHRYLIFHKLNKRVKFCPSCNSKNLKEAKYCMNCGSKIM